MCLFSWLCLYIHALILRHVQFYSVILIRSVDCLVVCTSSRPTRINNNNNNDNNENIGLYRTRTIISVNNALLRTLQMRGSAAATLNKAKWRLQLKATKTTKLYFKLLAVKATSLIVTSL